MAARSYDSGLSPPPPPPPPVSSSSSKVRRTRSAVETSFHHKESEKSSLNPVSLDAGMNIKNGSNFITTKKHKESEDDEESEDDGSDVSKSPLLSHHHHHHHHLVEDSNKDYWKGSVPLDKAKKEDQELFNSVGPLNWLFTDSEPEFMSSSPKLVQASSSSRGSESRGAIPKRRINNIEEDSEEGRSGTRKPSNWRTKAIRRRRTVNGSLDQPPSPPFGTESGFENVVDASELSQRIMEILATDETSSDAKCSHRRRASTPSIVIECQIDSTTQEEKSRKK